MKQTPQLLEGRGRWFCQACSAPGRVTDTFTARAEPGTELQPTLPMAQPCPVPPAPAPSSLRHQQTPAPEEWEPPQAPCNARGTCSTWAGRREKESKAQDLEKDRLLLALPTDPASQECLPSWSLTLGQPGENWTPGTLLTLPKTHPLAAACDRSPGPSAESLWSGKRHPLQEQLKVSGCFIRATHSGALMVLLEG